MPRRLSCTSTPRPPVDYVPTMYSPVILTLPRCVHLHTPHGQPRPFWSGWTRHDVTFVPCLRGCSLDPSGAHPVDPREPEADVGAMSLHQYWEPFHLFVRIETRTPAMPYFPSPAFHLPPASTRNFESRHTDHITSYNLHPRKNRPSSHLLASVMEPDAHCSRAVLSATSWIP